MSHSHWGHSCSGEARCSTGRGDAPRAEGAAGGTRPLLPGDVFSAFLLHPDSVDKPHFFIFFF